MKKMLVAALAAIICGTADAQIVSSTSREISTTKVTSNKRKYVQAGVGFLGMSGDGAKDLNSAVGFDFLCGFEKPLGNAGAWWGMEYGIGTSRGYKYKYEDKVEISYGKYYSDTYDITNTLRTYSLRYTPLNFGYRYAINDDFSVEAHLGVGVSFDFAGGVTKECDGESETISIYDEEDFRPVDVFMKLGAGINYKSVGFDISWQKGFIEPIKDAKITSSNVFLNLRYNF